VVTTYRIREARDARGWTQAELAKRANTTQQAIQRYESGEREPKVSAVISMAAALGVTVPYLLGIDHNDAPSLPSDEARLLSCYRSLGAEDRERVVGFAEALAVTGRAGEGTEVQAS
jgi:transcriptional regulator with XRE-family HTH domain